MLVFFKLYVAVEDPGKKQMTRKEFNGVATISFRDEQDRARKGKQGQKVIKP